jgi:excisionase family DNA binding protein
MVTRIGSSFKKTMQKRIKIKDIASYCLVSKTTVRRWIESGKLRAIRLPSGHYRVTNVDYRSFLESCEISHMETALASKLKRKEKN